jgi:hypothetical protein
LRHEGKQEDAIAEYLLAAEELDRQGDVEAVAGVYRRILELDERNVRALSALGESLAARGKLAEAIALAERALQLDDGNADRYERRTLFERANKPAEHERVLRRLAELYRSRGDESSARDILQRFAAVGELSDAGGEVAAPAADELSGGELIDDDDASALFGDEFPDTEGGPELSIDFGSELEIGPGASPGTPRPLIARGSDVIAPADELLLEDARDEAPPPSTGAAAAEASVYHVTASATRRSRTRAPWARTRITAARSAEGARRAAITRSGGGWPRGPARCRRATPMRCACCAAGSPCSTSPPRRIDLSGATAPRRPPATANPRLGSAREARVRGGRRRLPGRSRARHDGRRVDPERTTPPD